MIVANTLLRQMGVMNSNVISEEVNWFTSLVSAGSLHSNFVTVSVCESSHQSRAQEKNPARHTDLLDSRLRDSL